ncbi:MAG: nitrogenase [Clostridiales Family XIII bacterium]|jgi:nitrogenase molybdenum-iron protein alpha chain|nr:nitrogenase [Clostridiales Family XIII bacterium]
MKHINLDLPEVQVRELRLGTITGYQGNAADLVEGSSCGMKDTKRSFQQCLGCSTSQAACMVTLIRDAAVISHGPVGCSTCLHEFAFTYRVNAPLRGVENPTARHIISTNLDENDTVYGGAQKLKEAIKTAYDRAQPNAIFILTTCAAGIIGDDVEAISEEAEKQYGIPVVAIFCEGFRSRVWTSGFDSSYHGIARKIVGQPKERRKDVINVINFWGTDVFDRWFEPLGAKPNFITPYSTVDSLRHSSESAATVVVCKSLGSYLSAALESEYGVPAVKTPPPYGIAQTEKWYLELADILDKRAEAEAFLAEEKAKWLPLVDELRFKLKGKKAYVTAGAAHGHALLSILGELGLESVGASIFHHDQKDDSGAEDFCSLDAAVTEYGDVDNYQVCNKQEFELVNQLNRVDPDILLARHGGMTLWGAKFGIPSLLIGDEHFSMGFEGLYKYGTEILNAIENDEFVKNFSQHAVNPYTKWWLEQKPNAFHEAPKKKKDKKAKAQQTAV